MAEPDSHLRPRLYLAAPLFSIAERRYNSELRDLLSHYFQVFLPQDDGALLPDLIKSGLEESLARKTIFRNDIRAIQAADVLLMVLDGRAVDEGAAFECGYAFALGKKCIGLQTDVRRLLPIGNNPMLSEAFTEIFLSAEALLKWTASFCAARQSIGR